MEKLGSILPFSISKPGFLKSRGFTMVPNIILENDRLSVYEKMVFIIIKKHQMNKRKSWPSLSIIAVQSGCCVSSVQKAIRQLQKKEIIIKDRPDKRRSNIYKINVDKLRKSG